MKKSIFFIPVVLLFIGCGGNRPSLKNIFDTKGHSLIKEGKPVKKAEAAKCIAEFETKMLTRGFTLKSPTGTEPPVPVQPMQMTKSINFHGVGLSAWIDSISARAGGNLDTINFRIEFGIYTQEYVSNPDHREVAAFAGRISAFLVPYGISITKNYLVDDAFGDEVYNLGGLQP